MEIPSAKAPQDTQPNCVHEGNDRDASDHNRRRQAERWTGKGNRRRSGEIHPDEEGREKRNESRDDARCGFVPSVIAYQISGDAATKYGR